MREDWRTWVVQEARTWKGTKYVHKGRVKGVGVDCGGLLYQVYGQILPLPAFPDNYPQDWAMHKEGNEIYLDFLAPFVKQVKRPVAAGIAVFHYGRNFSHGAIVTEKGTYIHAYGRNDFGKVIESPFGFFQLGGEQREVRYYDVDPKWLS